MKKGHRQEKIKPKDVTGYLKEEGMKRPRMEMLEKLDDEGHLFY